jgi:peroxiredoxin
MRSPPANTSLPQNEPSVSKFFLTSFYLLALVAEPLLAQTPDAAKPEPQPAQEVLPGHSHFGEAFNEGPRQAAQLLGGTGNVKFAITTSVPEAQAFFNQGVGQLHGFWYFEAERSFRQTAKLDPNCAIAYWGMAMANVNNDKRAKGFIAEAAKRKDSASERERMYIEALDAYYNTDAGKRKERGQAYVKSLEQIVYKYPDDIEAKAFLVLQIWWNRDNGLPISSHVAVDALLDAIFAVTPDHPAHHYRIHLWDDERPEQALRAAAALGSAAPSIAHMWHMPGHTYSKLKRYRDAAWQQEASARVDHSHMIRTGLLPDQIHNFAHNNEWLIRNLVNLGRMHDAMELAKNMIELPQHPKYNTWDKRGSGQFGRQRLLETLAAFEQWDELVVLCHSEYLPATPDEEEQIRRLRHLGRAYVGRGDLEQATGQMLLLQERMTKKSAERDKAVADAEAKAKSENKDEKQIDQARDEARRPYRQKIEDLEELISELNGHITAAKGNPKAAIPLLEKGKAPKPEIARAQFLAGERESAEKTAREFAGSNPGEVLPLAHLVNVLWQLGKKEDAAKSFTQLRSVAADADLDNPVVLRLTNAANELGLPADWRLATPPASDIGQRPSLDSLGPFRWHPSSAPAWSLTDAAGATVTLDRFRGKPTILMFYLGHECLHCVEQLQAFAPMAAEFASEQIAIVAISSDKQTDLAKSVAAYEGGKFPFPLLANADLGVFRSYRAYDDFEERPLHGVFLIDGEGLIRWRDVGFEPFMDAKFVLGEARRLLGQSKHKRANPIDPDVTSKVAGASN